MKTALNKILFSDVVESGFPCRMIKDRVPFIVYWGWRGAAVV